MFRVDKNEVISELNLSLFGAKGFMQDRNKECPFCNKRGKWGIKFNDAGNNGAFHCFKCGMKTTLKKVPGEDRKEGPYKAGLRKHRKNAEINTSNR